MLSKATVKLIRGCHQKKQREKTKLFVAEGIKTNQSLLLSTRVKLVKLVCLDKYGSLFSDYEPIVVEDYKQLAELSDQKQPEGVLGVYQQEAISNKQPKNERVLLLDRIQDPGNLGTLIRLAHWYNLDKVIALKGSVDFYNPKVVQSSMGAVGFVDLEVAERFENQTLPSPILVADMGGENILTLEPKPSTFTLVLGNEANGVDTSILQNKNSSVVSIPGFNDHSSLVDSLNVSIAGGILLSHLVR